MIKRNAMHNLIEAARQEALRIEQAGAAAEAGAAAIVAAQARRWRALADEAEREVGTIRWWLRRVGRALRQRFVQHRQFF